LLEADRDKVKQVVLNMISNAIKYNRPDGSITLKADMEGEENLCILVQDTGVGIAQEALPHLFEKFYRVRDTEGQITGTGLGLSICKQIVQGHGGSIEVESELTHGTIFKIKLPLHPRSLRRDTRPLTSQRP
jgi:two-component system phosphate regulon sensor histidine kinase PhoR